MPDTTSLTTPAAPAPTPAPAPSPTTDDNVEGTQLVGTERMAPVGAVIAERRQRQEAQRERDALKQEIESIRQKASNYDIVEPYLPLLATHPKVTGKPTVPAPTNQPDPELVKIAKMFNFTNDTGEYDLEKAAEARDFMDTRADAKARDAVQPVAATAMEVQARALRERAYAAVDKSGRPFASRGDIDHVLDQMPVEQQADPRIVASAVMVARGMGVQGAPEPLHTEGAGGGGRGGGTTLSAMERAAAKARGMTDEQWTKLRDDDSNVLE